jgi:hypothetical protein
LAPPPPFGPLAVASFEAARTSTRPRLATMMLEINRPMIVSFAVVQQFEKFVSCFPHLFTLFFCANSKL